MPTYFFDTSALIKYYHEEAGRQNILTLTENTTNNIWISRLSYVEWHSTFARHIRMSEITTEEFSLLQSHFHADLRTQKFRITPLQASHFHQATHLLTTHALTSSFRTLDALQARTTEAGEACLAPTPT